MHKTLVDLTPAIRTTKHQKNNKTASLQKSWSRKAPGKHDGVNHGWLYDYGKPTPLLNSLMDRSSSGIFLHRHNLERSQMSFLPVYYPNYMLRRQRVQFLPAKKYPNRGILPMSQNDKRNHFRYFTLSYLPGSSNVLNKMKWPNYAFPYKNFSPILKTTPKANFYMLSQEKLRPDLHNRESYFTKSISPTKSLVPNYCIGAYKFDDNYANILPICIDKLPALSTPAARGLLNNTKYISTTFRLEPSTRSPYTQHFLSTTSLLNSVNTSNIYFTIRDAITPRTPTISEFKLKKSFTTRNYETYHPTDYNIPKSNTIASELWTMASNPINLHQTTSFSQPPNDPVMQLYSSNNDEKQKNTQDFNSFPYANMNTTQSYWSFDQFQHNTCTNSFFNIENKCPSESKDNTKDFISAAPLQVSTSSTTLKSLPVGTTTVFGTISTPLTKSPYSDNVSTTVLWNVTQESNYLSEKFPSTASTSTNRPTYRRSKIIQIRKRLVFKEKMKKKERNAKTLSSTLSTPIRSTESKSKEKRKYVSSTFPPPAQAMPSPRTTEVEPLLRVNSIVKKSKNKFQVKNRNRWTPSYERTHSKVNNSNITTSTAIRTALKVMTQPDPQRTHSANKLRSKVSRHNRRSNLMQISTTKNIPEFRVQSTTPMASSTPESAIMRILNIGAGKLSIAKSNSSNSLIPIPKPSNGFVAELPIVTYFKEVTESRQM